MKLYTEEQVILLLDLSKLRLMNSKDILLSQLTPIELPSDEEIEEYDDGSTKLNPRFYYDAFQDGAKWMKEQILNQNK